MIVCISILVGFYIYSDLKGFYIMLYPEVSDFYVVVQLRLIVAPSTFVYCFCLLKLKTAGHLFGENCHRSEVDLRFSFCNP